MSNGLRRAANAASESRRKGTGKPAKPWRVYGANNLSEDYSSQKAAYEAVAELAGFGHRATVRKFEDDRWRLYEIVEGIPAPGSRD